jgi:hypothetical protein
MGPTSFLYIYILLDEHKWAIPSAITQDQHKETTVRQMIHHIGLFSSDAALESNLMVRLRFTTLRLCVLDYLRIDPASPWEKNLLHNGVNLLWPDGGCPLRAGIGHGRTERAPD